MKHRWQLVTIAISIFLTTFTFFLTTHSQPSPPTFTTPLRIGILGDSTVDEYRGTDNRGGDFRDGTYNWLELLVMLRNFNAGPWGNWPEPRRLGYEYNWARSAATTRSLLEGGQHTGLAKQVSEGMIDLVVVSIGVNDFAIFNGYYEAVYSGGVAGETLDQKINNIISDYTLAVDTILSAREIPVIISGIPDQSLTPSVMSRERFADPAKRQIVSDAIRRANEGIIAMANERGLLYLDFDAMYLSLLPLIEKGFTIEGASIDLFAKGDDPHNGVLSDGIHPGTVIEGIVANTYLELINKALNLNIPLLTDAEIAGAAGLIRSEQRQP